VLLLLQALHREGVRYALVGGLAVSFHGILRMTEDADLFLDPREDNIEKLKKAMRSVWDDADIDDINAADFRGDYATIRYRPPAGEIIVDLISRLATAFQLEDIAWVDKVVDGVSVRLATPATLLKMKRDTLHERDRMDAADLREKFGLE